MSMPTNTEIIAEVIGDAYGVDITTSDQEQIEVMLRAFLVYKEREARYNELWKVSGAKDNAHHAKSKALRIEHQLSGVSDTVKGHIDPDDGYDLVNYAVFTIRNVRAGRIDPQGEVTYVPA